LVVPSMSSTTESSKTFSPRVRFEEIYYRHQRRPNPCDVRTPMSILITWPADDPSTVRQETHDPQQIATAMKAIGCRFERRPVRDLALDATPDEVLETYKDVVDELV